MGKLTSLPFQACQHRVSSLDAQPSVSNGILVFVTGQLLVCGALRPGKGGEMWRGEEAQPWARGLPPTDSAPPSAVSLVQPEGETNPLKFSQTFHLVPVGGSYIVSNDLFRLNYG